MNAIRTVSAEIQKKSIDGRLLAKYAQIEENDIVVDLTSDTDTNIAIFKDSVAPYGKVIGIVPTTLSATTDVTRQTTGFVSVEFRQGNPEELPLAGSSAHVVTNSHVLNLTHNVEKVFAEIFRVLKPGGRSAITAIIQHAELSDYLVAIEKLGFENIQVKQQQAVSLTDLALNGYLSEKEIVAIPKETTDLLYLTVYAEKPGNGMGVQSCVCS
ncbi:methyltransferase domain-containing protein [Cytophagaceae bacterium YF14B1]|uniref:Methyltransferase domain-containing protein n=1 Tax=Xanthocytophaga flava TaxID=3048013 RepID=A0AAE3QXJ2_9BACT|nr:methyltransferase domain-containing protein [Xanthocytophaga flavus]MDJ1485051.1 methyltransferase domain-containing protein [Xanthocytophaga flavus]